VAVNPPAELKSKAEFPANGWRRTFPGHTFAWFDPQETRFVQPVCRAEGLSPMGEPASILVVFDRLCSQIALALQQSQAHVYTAIALAIVLGLLLFPPKDDPDQI
jgi:hypothetical protein